MVPLLFHVWEISKLILQFDVVMSGLLKCKTNFMSYSELYLYVHINASLSICSSKLNKKNLTRVIYINYIGILTSYFTYILYYEYLVPR